MLKGSEAWAVAYLTKITSIGAYAELRAYTSIGAYKSIPFTHEMGRLSSKRTDANIKGFITSSTRSGNVF